ncbi:class I SAM-dependent methyltransferase [Ruegeria sp. R14_0]|uniref:class I SAM-dependent methyltransferase n=1 Tax=Ruegeria sp. R14_0 TaxID=2821100 RepID=UPI001ADBC50C|nr:class I SAM-dependent methyltransferase [Ruegeria sp. R14_0]MBO9445973.1 class I SAM-dependent methyltransferase [Ruegeria sp. R14_0]
MSDAENPQTKIAREALELLDAVPETPTGNRYLSEAEARDIINEMLEDLTEGTVEHTYLSGHQKRLAETLSVIPKAPHENAAFLDIGCFGYFGYWAKKYLGYGHIVGTEMPLDTGEPKSTREVSCKGETVKFEVFHFNLTEAEWPDIGQFDTAICLEVLEHVDHDPSGVMCRLRGHMKPDANLVFSVPNCVSYKSLSEFLSGMPPWTYWFYNPDLSHEPRHSLEYTPFLASLVLRAAGFDLQSLKTINAYGDPDSVAEIYEIGESLGSDPRMFGDTIITSASISEGEPPVRFPDAIYSGEGYYKSTWPLIDKIKRAKVEKTSSHKTPQDAENLERKIDELKLALERATSDARRKELQIQELTYLLHAADRRPPETINTPTDNRALLLYRLLSPTRIQFLAERGSLPEETNWKRQMIRHPLRVSEWKGLKRLLRRVERGEYKGEVDRL